MKFLGLARILVLSMVMCVCAVAQSAPVRPERGEEWLSWTPAQRSTYAYGFIGGYLGGYSRACNLADQLFEVGKPNHLGDEHRPTDMPSGRCLAHRGEFSKLKFDKEGHPDPSAYTDVVTAFYMQYPTCLDFPFTFLLEVLSHGYRSPDDLYKSALKGELENYELRSHQWCSAGNSQAPKS